jgi:hypothetical protein
MKRFASVLVLLLGSGCAIVDQSDKFGAEWDIGIGGILSYVADVHIKGSIGFSKTCPDTKKEATHETKTGAGGTGFFDDLACFL